MTYTLPCPMCGRHEIDNLGDGSSNNKSAIVLTAIIGGLLTGGILLLLLPVALFVPNTKPRADGSIAYRCRLCGHKWFHRPGTPWPEFTYRPHLIAAQEARFRQEEEILEGVQRRRRLMMYDELTRR